MEIIKSFKGSVNGKEKIEYQILDNYGVSILANAILSDNGSDVCIEFINVSRNERGKGIGTFLLSSIINDNPKRPISVVTFSNLVNWYHEHGFKKISQKGNICYLRRETS
ncbi:MAG: hypothetical protein ACTSSJ_02260 [Candidatus Odinarchaeia archaeon]